MLPQFLIVGAARCGTTSLHHYLAQHPGISMSSTKEPGYFLFDHREQPPRPLCDDRRIIAKSVPERVRYERLFRPGGVAGEATPLYLYTPHTPELIHALIPEARIVAILRAPAERAYSHFAYVNADLPPAALPEEFDAAVRRELPLDDTPYRSGTHFLRLGRYGRQLSRYADRFGRERVLVLRQPDLATDPARLLARVCAFVGVDDTFRFDSTVRYNSAAAAAGRSERVLRRVAPYVKRALPAALAGRAAASRHRSRAQRVAATAPGAPPMEPATRALLADYYRDELDRLEADFDVTL